MSPNAPIESLALADIVTSLQAIRTTTEVTRHFGPPYRFNYDIKPSSVNDLASGLPVSRPAVSQHLRVLKAAGLVRETAQGARRIYHLDPRGIGAMREWLDAHWSSALSAFKEFADAEAEKERQ